MSLAEIRQSFADFAKKSVDVHTARVAGFLVQDRVGYAGILVCQEYVHAAADVDRNDMLFSLAVVVRIEPSFVSFVLARLVPGALCDGHNAFRLSFGNDRFKLGAAHVVIDIDLFAVLNISLSSILRIDHDAVRNRIH